MTVLKQQTLVTDRIPVSSKSSGKQFQSSIIWLYISRIDEDIQCYRKENSEQSGLRE